MKILITGGAGFIGSNLCDFFLKQNIDVVCLDNFSTGYLHNIQEFLDHPQFTLIEGDIRDVEDCKKAVTGADYVLHQAALGSVPRSINDPITSTEVNIGGFVKILHASVGAGVKRFVYAASSSTYGDHPSLPKQEHIIGNPLSPYAVTKFVDEIFARNFSDIYGIETVGLRYFNVFGRRQDPNGAYAAVIPTFVKQLIRHQSPVINGDGSYSRDFTYIDNVIHANHLAVFTPSVAIKQASTEYYGQFNIDYHPEKTLSEVINVAFGEQTSLIRLAEYLQKELGVFDNGIQKIRIKHGQIRAGDIPHSLASIEKGEALFGYKPKYSVREGLSIAAKWYWENLQRPVIINE